MCPSLTYSLYLCQYQLDLVLVYRLIPDTPRFGEVLMAIDTSGDRPGNVIADIPHGASALGVALTRRPREIVKTYGALGSLLPGGQEARRLQEEFTSFIMTARVTPAVAARTRTSHMKQTSELKASTSPISPMTRCAFTSWRSAGSIC